MICHIKGVYPSGSFMNFLDNTVFKLPSLVPIGELHMFCSGHACRKNAFRLPTYGKLLRITVYGPQIDGLAGSLNINPIMYTKVAFQS